MSYSLEQFSRDCRQTLIADPGPGGVEDVRLHVEKACTDKAFIATYLGPDNHSQRKLLYRDPDLGFCILAHVYKGAKTSSPHDHGPSWAVYGQAAGVTEMTDWECVKKPTPDAPGLVRKRRSYALHPGMARAYQIGDLHSPHREGETRLIRIEGTNVELIDRDPYMIAPE